VEHKDLPESERLKVMTTRELANALRITERTVRENRKSGLWPILDQMGLKPYKFDYDQILGIVKRGSSSLKSESRRPNRIRQVRNSPELRKGEMRLWPK